MGQTILRVVILSMVFGISNAAHILGIPLPFRSHSLAMIRLLEQVEKYHGHTTTIILPDYFINESIVKESNMTYLIARNYSRMNLPEMERNVARSGFEGGSAWEKIILHDLAIMCGYLLTDVELLDELKNKKFNLAVVDNFLNSPCISILPYKLSVPYIHFGRFIDAILLRLPVSLSATPVNFFHDYSNPMTFTDRVINVLFFHLVEMIPYSLNSDSDVEEYAPEKPYLSKQELKAGAEMELIDYDILMDWPLAILPNIVHVGGLTTKPAIALRGPLAEFMDKSKHGAVVISFGSVATSLPESTINMLKRTFQKMKNINFVIKISGYLFKEDNVYSMPWLPQNDLLGHMNCKVFVTHCGNRGQFEALYHGVPMIGLPLFADQHYNARRMTMKGYGLYLDISKIKSDGLANTIQEVLDNPSYKTTIAKASEIFRNRPQSPAERAAFWVDHTIKFGGKHLQAHSANLPYYQYRLLDVYGFLLVCVTVVATMFYFITCKLIRKLCSKKKVKDD